MRYLIDGYNLLFQTAWIHHHDSLEAARKRLIVELDDYATLFNVSISIVFDAPLQNEPFSHGHFNQLKIIFTSRGQTADEFLIEWVEALQPAKNVTVVTSDKPLTRHIRAFGVKVEPVVDFLLKMKKRKQNKERKKPEKRVLQHQEKPKEPVAQERIQRVLNNAKNKILPPLSDLEAWEILFTEDS